MSTFINFEDLNSPDCWGNVPLHSAVLKNNFKMLDFLLHQPSVNLNHKNEEGRTPLLLSIKLYRSSPFVMQLIEAGCDVNICDNYKETPLHAAVSLPTIDIADELIKSGAKINVQDIHMQTPLHCAIYSNNLQATCMLLYYGADVNIMDSENKLPLMYAAEVDISEFGNILIDYYDKDGISCADVHGITALHRAVQLDSLLAVKLLEAGADVNCVTLCDISILEQCLFLEKAYLFRLIWSKFDYYILLSNEKPFLSFYVENCQFSNCGWLECLQLILESPIVSDLVQHCFIYTKYDIFPTNFIEDLLMAFYKRKIQLSSRMNIIYLCLYVGLAVNIKTINVAYELYGFNKELEIFIYFADYSYINECSELNFLLPYILGLEDNTSNAPCRLGSYGATTWNIIPFQSRVDSIVYALKFFSRAFNSKLFNTNSAFWLHLLPICDKLQAVPSVPTLLELSRNQTRKFIKQSFVIKTPYQFFDIIKNINLPKKLIDIILFKTPLY